MLTTSDYSNEVPWLYRDYIGPFTTLSTTYTGIISVGTDKWAAIWLTHISFGIDNQYAMDQKLVLRAWNWQFISTYHSYNAGIKDYNLPHWSRVTHIYISELSIICSDNGFSPGRRLSIIWTNAGILLIGPMGANFREIIHFHSKCIRRCRL